jgi:hypothetical protein
MASLRLQYHSVAIREGGGGSAQRAIDRGTARARVLSQTGLSLARYSAGAGPAC